MIKTKTAIKRDIRNGSIRDRYKDYMATEGSMKSAVVERIAKELKTSITTVNRIVKSIQLKEVQP